MIAHEIRARLHAVRLHVTFLERSRKATDDPELVETLTSASEELRQLEQLVLAHLAMTTSSE